MSIAVQSHPIISAYLLLRYIFESIDASRWSDSKMVSKLQKLWGRKGRSGRLGRRTKGGRWRFACNPPHPTNVHPYNALTICFD
jgi:hypothetical protein